MDPVALTERREKGQARTPTHTPTLPPPGPALGTLRAETLHLQCRELLGDDGDPITVTVSALGTSCVLAQPQAVVRTSP